MLNDRNLNFKLSIQVPYECNNITSKEIMGKKDGYSKIRNKKLIKRFLNYFKNTCCYKTK